MIVVWWSEMYVGGSTYELPEGPVLRAEAVSDSMIELWIEVDTDHLDPFYTLIIIGTGHPVPEDMHHYASTTRTPSGLVWHIYGKRIPGSSIQRVICEN